MNKITVSTSHTYDVIMDNNLLKRSGQLIREALVPNTQKICIVTDDIVDSLYSGVVWESLEAAGFQVCKYVFPHGESHKSIETLGSLLDYLADQKLTRSDALAALGGGIAGDLCGFAAASYLRGVAFVQIPTTFLAAVDSSVGGKTGINLKAGKNLAGAFWQPSLVLYDPGTADTLSHDLFLDGLAETVKASVIADPTLFDYISHLNTPRSPDAMAHMVAAAIEVKRAVVESDEKDTGQRQLLNLGHTVGHAIEKCSKFSISHGHAVAIGMRIAAQASAKMGWCDPECSEKIIRLLTHLEFPMDCAFPAEDLTSAALNDKKRMGDTITVVIPQSIGNCRLKKIPVDTLYDFIKAGVTK